MKPRTKKFIQQRRFFMVLPILVLPFITMIFWALGGGKTVTAPVVETKSGLNAEIPFAHFDNEDEQWDKFALYEQAKRDSIKYQEAKRNDPYYVISTLEVKSPDSLINNSALNTSLGKKGKYSAIEQDEMLINEKLQKLTAEISRPQESMLSTPTKHFMTPDVQPAISTPEVDRLEKMMEVMAEGRTSNPEMEQMQDVLNKILDIQHPERISDKIREESLEHRNQVFPVEAATEDKDISIFGEQQTATEIQPVTDSSGYQVTAVEYGFFGLDDQAVSSEQISNSIEAVIHDTQTVVTGSTIRMRLTSDVFINGQLIERDQFIWGTCAVNGDRLTVSINSIQHESSLLPVALSVYDLDGIAGVSIPGAITRDAAKQASSQSIQDVELYPMGNSIGVQAATAGLEAAKGLFSKKAKLVKATVKAGHQILLKDNNQKLI